MRIILEERNIKVIVEVKKDATIFELMEGIIDAIRGIGYTDKTIKTGLKTKGDEL